MLTDKPQMFALWVKIKKIFLIMKYQHLSKQLLIKKGGCYETHRMGS